MHAHVYVVSHMVCAHVTIERLYTVPRTCLCKYEIISHIYVEAMPNVSTAFSVFDMHPKLIIVIHNYRAL